MTPSPPAAAPAAARPGLTSAANGALGAHPVALSQGLGVLAQAAHVVGSWAAVAADEVAALAAQHAAVGVGIRLGLRQERRRRRTGRKALRAR